MLINIIVAPNQVWALHQYIKKKKKKIVSVCKSLEITGQKGGVCVCEGTKTNVRS